MALRMILNSIAVGLLLFLTAVILPGKMNINENASKILFVTITLVLFTISKDKWWKKIFSLILSIVFCMILIVLLIR